MAWYNPATWKPVDYLQGQSNKPQAGGGGGGGGWGSGSGDLVIRTGPTSSYNPAPTPADNSNADIIRNLNSQLAAMRAQTAAMPRLPSFDLLGNYNRARAQAEQNQRPMYDKMLNTFLEGQGIKKTAKQQEVALGKENVATEQRYTKEDNQGNRVRTAEDVAAAIEQINTGEAQFQTDEGKEFDTARRGLQEGMAASGLTTSGLGQGAIGEQQDERNIVSGRQTEQFQLQRGAKELFKNRTFEDLQKGDLRADEKAVLANKSYDLDLDSYLQELAHGEKEYKQDWEVKLAEAIYNDTQLRTGAGVKEFLMTLPGSGQWRSQDIAEAGKFYGQFI